MIQLTDSIKAWNSADFKPRFIAEVQRLDGTKLPLQAGLSLSSYALFDDFKVVVLNTDEDADSIFVKAGLFYTGIISGCSCADDPTPQDEQNEYCEVMFNIEKNTGFTSVSLIDT
ncbi:hypothetical protein QCB45_00065 [Thiomicrorhabdus sp. ZW0627]|uniref:hypothetical protein n=1 Tax=Thiomicrorhabdus sp. ZW0627 TaxID=3039774 RepID=UPI0024370311|nr:hypothetical protein [Thiomicrorhabdus sp. ZW0627]MDG6772722.1 hypothetical protein [Thiomicrorhabdus sp. ZW0627]